MTNPKPLTPSERCARALLAAWNSGELARLEAALDRAASAPETQPAPSEEERIELVREIASTIRAWLEGVRQETQSDLRASLKLLRHVARCESIRDEGWIGNPVAATPGAPRSETPAFVRS